MECPFCKENITNVCATYNCTNELQLEEKKVILKTEMVEIQNIIELKCPKCKKDITDFLAPLN